MFHTAPIYPTSCRCEIPFLPIRRLTSMDPISVISGITGIIISAAGISKTLQDVWSSYQNAPSTVRYLIHECYAINGALSQLHGWLYDEDPAVRSNRRFIQLDLLVNTISAAMCTFTELQAKVEKLTPSGPTSKLMSFKFIWEESDMQALLRQLQSHKTSLTLMLTILSRFVKKKKNCSLW